MGQKQEKLENNSSSRNSLEDKAELNGLKIIKSYTGKDYGPLDFYDEEKTGSEIKYLSNIHSRNFQGGSYILATPKEGTTLNFTAVVLILLASTGLPKKEMEI